MTVRPIDLLISKLRENGHDPQPAPGKDQWLCLCPAHDDTTPSCSVGLGDDGRALISCFKGCSAAEIVVNVGLTMSQLFPGRSDAMAAGRGGKTSKRPQGKKTSEYEYRDADGIVIYKAVRYDATDGTKTFTQCRPNPEGGWIFNMRGIERILYRLPELIASTKEDVVYVVEGEKKVEALRKWGLIATCNVGGAGKWAKSYSARLADRHVIILPDNDPIDPRTGLCPGRDHARKVLESLIDVAASVRILDLPDLPPKGDVVDWQEAGHGLPEFMQLVTALRETGTAPQEESSKVAKSAPTFDPASVEMDNEVLRRLGLDVLGEIEGSNGRVKVFSEFHRKTDVIADVGRLSLERLLQICGTQTRAVIYLGRDRLPDGMFTLSDVRQAIAVASGLRRISDDSEAGRGIWQGIDDHGNPNNSIILVGSGEAAKWNGDKTLHKILKPRSDGRLLDLGSSDPWYQFDILAELMQRSGERDWCMEVIFQAEQLFARWKWRNQEQSPLLIVGLLLSNWVQTIWNWRPMVAISGASNTGKSTLYKALDGLFGGLGIVSSNSSAAGLRQAIQKSASIVMCDEFESSKHRADIFEMLRASSRGDKVLRGTMTHKGQQFVLRHIVWTAATESGLKSEPDVNRFILLELMPPPAAEAGQLSLPTVEDLHLLGQKLLAIAIRHAIEARSLSQKLKSVCYEGKHQRIVESYAVPASILAAAYGLGFDDATGLLGRLLRVVRDAEIQSDKERILEAILESQIDCGQGERITVSQAIFKRHTADSERYEDALEKNGIGIAAGRGEGGCLFFGSSMVSRHLLYNTEFKGLNIGEVLSRFEGASDASVRHRIAGQHPRGVFIPASYAGVVFSE